MIRFKAIRWTPQELAARLCQVIYGDERVFQLDRCRWQIGAANDWWLHLKEDGTFLLHHRYGKLERLRALADVLDHFLDVEIIEIS